MNKIRNENGEITTDNTKPIEFSKSSAKGKVHSNSSLPQEQEKNQINNLTLHLKQLEKEEIKNPRVSTRKEIIKIRAEINEKETKVTIAKINKTKSWFFEKINKIDEEVIILAVLVFLEVDQIPEVTDLFCIRYTV